MLRSVPTAFARAAQEACSRHFSSKIVYTFCASKYARPNWPCCRRLASVARAGAAKQLEESFTLWLEDNAPPSQVAVPADLPLKVEQESKVGGEDRFHWWHMAHLLRQELHRGCVEWDVSRRAFICRRSTGKSTALLQPPRLLPTPMPGQAPEEYLAAIVNARGKTVLEAKTLMVLLSADSAVLGLWEGDVLRRHRVFTGYTTRKQQGMSQSKYLRRGGPGHSVGGNLRSRESKRLFDEAAAKLQSWEADIAKCSQAFMSGDVRAWNSLYEAEPLPPIARDDPRWERAGLSIRRPRLRDCQRLFRFLSYGMVQTLVPDHAAALEQNGSALSR